MSYNPTFTLKNPLITYVGFALIVAVAFFLATDSWAAPLTATASEDVFGSLKNKLSNLFTNIRTVVYVAGAFALVAVAIAGLIGKVNWRTVAHLAAGLFVMVIAAEIINYVIGDTENTAVDTSKQTTTFK
jgi:type IV secretory pathway VirB2 component (pilin)